MGYIGDRSARKVIFSGLQRLEYRGYDSAGIAVLDTDLCLTKAVGDTAKLKIKEIPAKAHVGIGHTRWATHGKPSTANAHPHTYGAVTLVHNGIIENYEELKKQIDASMLKSQTDSEVLAALIDKHLSQTGELLESIKLALAQVNGTFGIAVITPSEANQVIVARRGSPIVIGVDDNQHYIASDSAAIIDHTDKVIYLEDDQIAVVKADDLELFDLRLNKQDVSVELLEDVGQSLNLDGYSSFLEKEINEQPQAIENLMRGRVKGDSITLGGPGLTLDEINEIDRIVIVGCGTAYYAGSYAKYELEKVLGIPVVVEHASEFRYRYGAYNHQTTLAIFMSQSGETADTLASLREAKRRNIKTMGIVNVVGSTIAREVTNGGIYLHAGTESSVASTKAYSSMVAALLMFGGFMSYRRGGDSAITTKIARELAQLPEKINHTLGLVKMIEKLASGVKDFETYFVLGRGQLHPVALEGALKLTEVVYEKAFAFPTGEMKHGPIALIDDNHLSIVLLPDDELLYAKSVSALEEIKSRGGHILTISTREKEKTSDMHLMLDHNGDHTDGLLYNVCVQLLTLKLAEIKGRNIDRPRNLAKSVTVE